MCIRSQVNTNKATSESQVSNNNVTNDSQMDIVAERGRTLIA